MLFLKIGIKDTFLWRTGMGELSTDVVCVVYNLGNHFDSIGYKPA